MKLFKRVDDKKVPVRPTTKVETIELTKAIEKMAQEYSLNLALWREGNKAAGRRARTTMHDLVKLSPVLNKAMTKTDREEW